MACNAPLGVPCGGGTRSQMAWRRSGTPSPVFALTLTISLGIDAERMFHLLRHLVDPGMLEIDLVDDGQDRQIVFHGGIGVGDRLRFDALKRIDQQQCAFAAGQRPGDLVLKVHVAGRIDQVQFELLLALLMAHRDGPRLDRDTPRAFQRHIVEQLVFHQSRIDSPGGLQQPVGKRALAVVDVRDDAEVADVVALNHAS